MAVDWIKMRVNLADDPRVVSISRSLGCNAVSVIGALYVLWAIGDQHSVDGTLKAYTPDYLDRKVEMNGFTKALSHAEVGWMEIGPNYLKILNFHEHNGDSAKNRAQTQQRVKRYRDREKGVTQRALPEIEIEENKNITSASADVTKSAAAKNEQAPKSSVDQTPKPRKQPSGAHHEFFRAFDEAWKTRYGEPYTFFGAKDGEHVKWILSALHHDMGQATKVIANYIADDDEFLIKQRHSLGLLKSQFNRFRIIPEENQRRNHVTGTNGRRARTAAERGEYASQLPSGGQKLAPVADVPDEEPA